MDIKGWDTLSSFSIELLQDGRNVLPGIVLREATNKLGVDLQVDEDKLAALESYIALQATLGAEGNNIPKSKG